MTQSELASRRNFLKTAGLIGAASLSTSGAKAEHHNPQRSPKNLIFLVADGMGTGTLTATHAWSKQMEGKGLEWFDLYDEPNVVRSLQDTASANAPVTDSAAAASAWGGGKRVNNGALNITPTGEKPQPLFTLAKAAGKATGLVTTCRVTHATPAGFVVNIESRDSEDAIAELYLKHEMDVYLGGGLRHFTRENEDLIALFERKGYVVAKDRSSLKHAEKASKILGLFSDSHMPYKIDREHSAQHKSMPSLEEMFEASLRTLEKHEEGFVLQVESGRIDHSAHENDPATTLHEQLEFDRCIKIAREFIQKNPDTLLIVTTDHGTGGCQLNGAPLDYVETPKGIKNLSEIKGSFESLNAAYKETKKFDSNAFERITTIPVSPEKAAEVEALVPMYRGWFAAAVGAVFSEELLALTNIGWTSHHHTAEHVEFVAMGQGCEAFPPLFNNNEVYSILRSVLKV